MKDLFKKLIKPLLKQKKVKTFAENVAVDHLSLFEYLPITDAIEIIKESNQQFFPITGFSKELKGILCLSDLTDFVLSIPENQRINLKNYFLNSVTINDTVAIDLYASYSDILAKYSQSKLKVIPIVDEHNRYLDKCIISKSLILSVPSLNRPKTVGGLATPLGVYMTDGHFITGAGIPGLILTGILFSIILNSITLLSLEIINVYHIPESLMLLFQLSLFIAIIRISPLAGLHAAEHQTIHAIEKGIELTIENVKSQPRAHIRCGTNYMIILISFSLLITLYYDFLNEMDFLVKTLYVAIITALIIYGWRKAGEKLQNNLTTAKATDKQLESGIKAGKELLNLYSYCVVPSRISPLKKIWNMGVIQIITAFSITSIFFHLIIALFSFLK